ncbi:MAG: QueT transporter family protein [Clostridiaceae bacterium]|jgi:uncharacterized membrane protein|nr:QueT transporter family protein [Clostridiaceae bacterium]
MKKPTTLQITQAAVVTAAYVLLTLPFAQFAFGPIQFRLAEAMTVLPVLFPAAVPGLFLGCLLSNLFNPNSLGPIDIVFGSLATLLAALATWRIARKTRGMSPSVRRGLSLLPPVVINALVVGSYLPFLLMDAASSASPLSLVPINMLTVGASEAVVVFVVGLPLLVALEKRYPARMES